MAHLTVNKETGEPLFDTNLICYGLVKSGYMAYIESWSRRQRAGINNDPNDGNSWSPSLITVNPANRAEAIHGFTVVDSLAPIVFIVGPGTSAGFSRSGNSVTYMYANATPATKFYCFDLMADNIPGSPYLKTYTDGGVLTFNSLQPPLNIVASIRAPDPGALISSPTLPSGSRFPAYVGGYVNADNVGANNQYNLPRAIHGVDIALTPGVEYAAYLPWSRSCGIYDTLGSLDTRALYGGAEGAYGRIGGISFMFGPSAASTVTFQNYQYSGNAILQLPIDRFPTAMVIKTGNLPFPYS